MLFEYVLKKKSIGLKYEIIHIIIFECINSNKTELINYNHT